MGRTTPSVSAPLIALLGAFLAGCSFVSDQIHISSASSCIQKTCGKETDANGYQRCEAACRSTYGR